MADLRSHRPCDVYIIQFSSFKIDLLKVTFSFLHLVILRRIFESNPSFFAPQVSSLSQISQSDKLEILQLKLTYSCLKLFLIVFSGAGLTLGVSPPMHAQLSNGLPHANSLKAA